jgi:CRISPR/Cas system-associated exonuclease Cas4 (RecB family)
MKIKCSNGKGELSHTDCLECARAGGNTCGFDYSLLHSVYRSRENRTEEIHVTDLLSCPRKVYLGKVSPAAEMPHQMMAAYKGLAVHGLLEHDNNAIFGMSEPSIVIDGLAGRPDFIMKMADGKNRLVDYKTAKEIYVDLVPYGEHEGQVNIYAWMLEKIGVHIDEMCVQYISMAGPTQCKKCRTTIEWSLDGYQCLTCGKIFPRGHLGVMLVPIRRFGEDEILQVIDHRKGLLKTALQNKELPVGEPGWLCKYCTHTCDMREGADND